MDKTEHAVNLLWVNPVNLHGYWDRVLDGLKVVKKHGDHWKVEDVYHAIKSGSASLHVAYVDDDYKGFLVTQQQTSFDGIILQLWACYSNEKRQARLLEATFPQLVEWANNIGAKRISFSSPRKGWERNTLGFKPVQIIYEYEVTK